MKIILTESQFDKHLELMKKTIDRHGFHGAMSIFGSGLKLAKILNIPIKGGGFVSKNDVQVSDLFKDLVRSYGEYRNCKLTYNPDEMIIEWDVMLETDDWDFNVNAHSTPYFNDIDYTLVDISTISVFHGINQNRFDVLGQYKVKFKTPESFENADELIDWWKNDYLPTTYDAIIESVIDFAKKNYL